MAVDQAFIDRVSDLFAFVPDLRARRMFGAAALYSGDALFALIDDGEVWLKVDEQSRPRFDALDLPNFSYPTRDGVMQMPKYRQMPSDAWDDDEAARLWGRLALDATLRLDAARPPKRATRKRA